MLVGRLWAQFITNPPLQASGKLQSSLHPRTLPSMWIPSHWHNISFGIMWTSMNVCIGRNAFVRFLQVTSGSKSGSISSYLCNDSWNTGTPHNALIRIYRTSEIGNQARVLTDQLKSDHLSVVKNHYPTIHMSNRDRSLVFLQSNICPLFLLSGVILWKLFCV